MCARTFEFASVPWIIESSLMRPLLNSTLPYVSPSRRRKGDTKEGNEIRQVVLDGGHSTKKG